jgi:GTP-binding protein HflX
VWNKIDLLAPDSREFLALRTERDDSAAVAVSAATGEGIERLTARLAGLVDEGPLLTIALCASDGEGLAWLYRHGRVVARQRGDGDDMIVTAKLAAPALAKFELLRPSALQAAAAE